MTLLDKLLSSFIQVSFASKYFPVHPFSLLYYYSYTSLVLSTMQKKKKKSKTKTKKSKNKNRRKRLFCRGTKKWQIYTVDLTLPVQTKSASILASAIWFQDALH